MGAGKRRASRGGAAAGLRAAPPAAERAAEPGIAPGSQREALSEETAAFYGRLWDSARVGCLNLLRSLGCGEEEAEEIFRDTHLRVMERVDPIRRDLTEAQMVNTMKVSCRRQLMNVRRREGVLREVAVPEVRYPVVLDEADVPYESAALSEAIAVGQEAVLALSPRDRLVFRLRHHQGLTPEEIRQRVPRLTPGRYRRIIERSNAQVLATLQRIESGARCRELEDSELGQYLGDIASAEEAAQIESHLKHCRHCQRRLLELRGRLHDLGSTLALVSLTGAVGAGTPGLFLDLFSRLGGVPSAIGQVSRPLRDTISGLASRAMRLLQGGGESGAGQILGVSGGKAVGFCAGVAAAGCAAAGIVSDVGGVEPPGSHPRAAKTSTVGKTPVGSQGRAATVTPTIGGVRAHETAGRRVQTRGQQRPHQRQPDRRSAEIAGPRTPSPGLPVANEFGPEAEGVGTSPPLSSSPEPTETPAAPSSGSSSGHRPSEFGL